MLNRFNLRNKDLFFSAGLGQDQKKFIVICLLSLFVHGLFFAGMMLFQNLEISKPLPRVLQVDLVSFVPGPVGGQTNSDFAVDEKKATSSETLVPLDSTIKKTAQVKKIEPVARLKPDISLKAKPKNLKELMAIREKKDPPPPKSTKLKPAKALKPKPDPEEKLKNAREEMARKIEEKNQEQILEALNRMKASIEADTGDRDPGPGVGNGTGLGKIGYNPIDLYKMKLQYAIEQNWVFNDMLARMNQHLEVRVMMKILQSGEIRDISYETKSGNRYLDESAKKAIKRANPLPMLPKGMKSYDVVVIFTPKGLK
jgi:colicin import membrane protein